MRAFFDTSVLIPVFIEDHEHHERSLKAFVDTDKKRDCCAAHSLAEVYSTMTRLPGRHRLSGEQVLLFLENIRERLTLITLTGGEYHATIKDATEAGVIGGTIYGALIARCAPKAKVEAVYTWNTRHFQRFGAAIVKRLRTLSDGPKRRERSKLETCQCVARSTGGHWNFPFSTASISSSIGLETNMSIRALRASASSWALAGVEKLE